MAMVMKKAMAMVTRVAGNKEGNANRQQEHQQSHNGRR
jgi:hypothetical protein